jgi:hypothetical protein
MKKTRSRKLCGTVRAREEESKQGSRLYSIYRILIGPGRKNQGFSQTVFSFQNIKRAREEESKQGSRLYSTYTILTGLWEE